jgi:hypothetical protein
MSARIWTDRDGTTVIVIRRVPHDRGVIHIDGEKPPGMQYLESSPCMNCGFRVWTAYLNEPTRKGITTRNDADDAFECIACGAVMTRYDFFGWEEWNEMEKSR